MNCKVKQGCLTSESCCILLWLAFTLFPVSVVTAADNRKIDESQQKEVKAEMKGYVGDENGEPVIGAPLQSHSLFSPVVWRGSACGQRKKSLFPAQPTRQW